jgi:hypothetical protein
MPLQATSGAASYDAFGGGVPVVPNYIEDVFSTWLYTGTGATQSITNNIDLSTKGGLVWFKPRTPAGYSHWLFDTSRGVNKGLSSDATYAQQTLSQNLTAFNTTGFTLGTDSDGTGINSSGISNVSWTFRKQPKFFDVVTFTTASDGSATVSHALGSTPAFVIVKRTDSTGLWFCWHTSLPSTNYYLFLNTTSAQTNSGGTWLTPSSTQVSFPSNSSTGALDSSANYVMYVYASNAGGFGLTGTDNVISCGSVSATGSAQSVSVGYEPQWILWKKSSGLGSWWMFDTMRGLVVDNGSGTGDKYLLAESANAEAGTYGIDPTATGFNLAAGWGAGDYIYITIRRGPMKVPTSGTSVFSPAAETPSGSANYVMNSSSGFPVDMFLYKARNNVATPYLTNRLTNNYLQTASTAAEAAYTYGYDLMQGVRGAFDATSQVDYAFRRAPSFFDEVCYTGNATARTLNHNLTVAPELLIVRSRSEIADWFVWVNGFTISSSSNQYLSLNYSDAKADKGSSEFWNSSYPTSSVFGIGNSTLVNNSGSTYVAYLFATCAGVSKVGSYTGTGALQTVNCGFTSGARFVLIKRTDSTGDWWTYDSARGITSGNDPYLLLNSTAAEVTGTNYVDTDSTGFKVTAAAPAALNASGGTYIFLAIA